MAEVGAPRIITSSFLDCRLPPAPTGGGDEGFPGFPRPTRRRTTTTVTTRTSTTASSTQTGYPHGGGDSNSGYLNNGINTGVIQNGDQITEVNAGEIHTGDNIGGDSIGGDQINGDKIGGDQIKHGIKAGGDVINSGNSIDLEAVLKVDVSHTSYIVVFPAADHSRTWMATYTVNADCPGACAQWHNNADPDFVPPNFVVSTVECDVCAVRQQTVTCPNALGVDPVTIQGNGITATVVVTDEPRYTLPAVVAPAAVADPALADPEEDDDGDDVGSFGPVGAPPSPPVGGGAALPVVPAPGSSRTLGSFSPVVTAAAPRSVSLKQGLSLFVGLGLAMGGLVLA